MVLCPTMDFTYTLVFLCSTKKPQILEPLKGLFSMVPGSPSLYVIRKLMNILNSRDISNNPLICDCALLWILDWIQKKSVKLISNPKCNTPESFRNQLLRKVRIGDDIHCKSSAASVEMRPKENQVCDLMGSDEVKSYLDNIILGCLRRRHLVLAMLCAKSNRYI